MIGRRSARAPFFFFFLSAWQPAANQNSSCALAGQWAMDWKAEDILWGAFASPAAFSSAVMRFTSTWIAACNQQASKARVVNTSTSTQPRHSLQHPI
jgi:hypothetical protein